MTTATRKFIELSSEEWEEQFQPIENHISGRGAEDISFDTHGDEGEFALFNAEKLLVWTLCEEDGKVFITQGMRWVNRILYYVCKKPYPKNTDYLINI